MISSLTPIARPRALDYGLAGASVGLAFAAMLWNPLHPLLSPVLMLAIVLNTWRVGRRAGLIVAVGGIVALLAPRWFGESQATTETSLLSAGLCTLLLLGWVLAALERSRAERDARRLETLSNDVSSARASAGVATAVAASDSGLPPPPESDLRQISHDLVQPLAAISNYAELIRGLSSGDVQGYAREIAGLSARMAKGIREVLHSRRGRLEDSALDPPAREAGHDLTVDIKVEGPE